MIVLVIVSVVVCAMVLASAGYGLGRVTARNARPELPNPRKAHECEGCNHHRSFHTAFGDCQTQYCRCTKYNEPPEVNADVTPAGLARALGHDPDYTRFLEWLEAEARKKENR
jgi:hypothetical protein